MRSGRQMLQSGLISAGCPGSMNDRTFFEDPGMDGLTYLYHIRFSRFPKNMDDIFALIERQTCRRTGDQVLAPSTLSYLLCS